MLGELIDFLEEQPSGKIIKYGFGEPDSYRGYYNDVAFEPVENTTIGEMLKHAKQALGQTFNGYKGGEYTMHEHSDCWIAPYGISTGDAIGPTLMKYWSE